MEILLAFVGVWSTLGATVILGRIIKKVEELDAKSKARLGKDLDNIFQNPILEKFPKGKYKKIRNNLIALMPVIIYHFGEDDEVFKEIPETLKNLLIENKFSKKSAEAFSDKFITAVVQHYESKIKPELILALKHMQAQQKELLSKIMQNQETMLALLGSGSESFTNLIEQINQINFNIGSITINVGTLPIQYDPDKKEIKTVQINLAPHPTKTFVGRVKQLENLHGMLAGGGAAGISGLVGSGGIGKTELAKKYAHDYKEHYPGGIFWISFDAEETMPLEHAVRRMMMELGVPEAEHPSTQWDAEAKLIAQVNNKEALLILDNVVDQSQLVDHKNFTLIVTTRDRRIAEMVAQGNEMPLDALTDDESLELLRRKLGEERIKKDRASAERIIEICGQMPLALDIVCSLIQSDEPDKQLVDFIAYLTSGSVLEKLKRFEGRNEKDKSVFASLNASMEFIRKNPERFIDGEEMLKIFKASSVCAVEGFWKESVAAAASIEPEKAGRLLTALSDLNIIKRGKQNESNFYFLHPLVRELAESEAMENEKEFNTSILRYLEYFLRFTEENKAEPMDLIYSANEIWQAMVWAIRIQEPEKAGKIIENVSVPFFYIIEKKEAEGAFFFLRASRMIFIDDLGFFQELSKMLEALLDMETIKNIEKSYIAATAELLGLCYLNLGRIEDAITRHEQARKLYKDKGDRGGEAREIGNLGTCYTEKGDLDQAIKYHKDALNINREIKARMDEARQLGSLGSCYGRKDELDQAIKYIQEALEIDRENGARIEEAKDLGNLGNCYMLKVDFNQAIKHLKEALEIQREIGDRLSEARQLGNLGSCFKELGEIEICMACWIVAFSMFEQMGAGDKDIVGGGLAILRDELGEEKFVEMEADVTGRLDELISRAVNWGKEGEEGSQ